MLSLYRITRNLYPPQDPAGGLHVAGRWHPVGFPILYFCSSLPMCIFELRANQVPFASIRSGYHYTRCDVEPLSLETVPDGFYREGWTRDKESSQRYGADWLRSGRTLLLAVRSAPLPTETNYLVNPRHPGFAALAFSAPAPVPLDARIA